MEKIRSFSVALTQLTQLLRSVDSLGEEILEETIGRDYDKLMILVNQATKSIGSLVEFLQSTEEKELPASHQNRKIEHVIETPKNVSKRRKKPGERSVGSPLEELQLELDLAELSSDLDWSSRSLPISEVEDQIPATVLDNSHSHKTEASNTSIVPDTEDFDSPRRSDDSCDKRLPDGGGTDLFSEPVSPIASLQPTEDLSASQLLLDGSNRLAAVNSTLNSSRKEKERVRFGEAEYFYFSRCQGWSSVPRDGGNSLGMAASHFHYLNTPLSDLSLSGDSVQEGPKKISQSYSESNSTATEALGSFLTTSCEESLLESDSSLNTSKAVKKGELGTRGLQRISSRKRRALLKSCSVDLDPKEAEELRRIRESREAVGCDCPGGRCEADRCSCAAERIQCHQVRGDSLRLTIITDLYRSTARVRVPAQVLGAAIRRDGIGSMRPKWRFITWRRSWGIGSTYFN